MPSKISFVHNGEIKSIDFTAQAQWQPTTTILQYLRSLPNYKGTKEGCAEGDCGACTVVLAQPGPDNKLIYTAVNSCLLFLPKLHGKQLITVEDLQDKSGHLHPVQKVLAESNGSQCGFCTPGFVMSLFAQYKSGAAPNREQIEDSLSGNLCRCTGYQPILESAKSVLDTIGPDHFSKNEQKTLQLLKMILKESITLKTEQQIYHLPCSLKELLHLKAEYPQALLTSGATDVALRVTKKHEALAGVIDLSAVTELQGISANKGRLHIGSAVSIRHLMTATELEFPALYKMCKTFGSEQIRNIATIGGNLASASPIGDLAPVLMAYRATLILESQKGQRQLPLEKFISGYHQTKLEPDEIMRTIELQPIAKNILLDAYKISRRYDLDIATVSAAFRVELKDDGSVQQADLIYGGMAETTCHARHTEQFLKDKKWERDMIERAMVLIKEEFNPISDARADAAFRRIGAANLLLKFYLEHNLGK